jgi:hypothetical protein
LEPGAAIAKTHPESLGRSEPTAGQQRYCCRRRPLARPSPRHLGSPAHLARTGAGADASGILADYLTPAEVATEFGIRENQLSEWKRNRFGSPRRRLKRRVMYGREAVRDWLRSLEENSAADGGAAGDWERSQR